MATLAFQTAFGPAEIALLTGDDWPERSMADPEGGPGQDARLPGLVETLLAAEGLDLSDVNRIGVVTGPGSFTGLRMGLAFARGLGLVLGCPVLGISLLEAALPPDNAGRVRVALQAQRRPPDITFWCQDFIAGTPEAPPVELHLDEVRASGRTVLTDRSDLLAGHVETAPAQPRAAFVARWSLRRNPETAPPSPVYVRPPDAALPGPASR